MNKETLAQVRQELDALDEQIHDLLKQRTQVVERVAEAKARANNGVVGFAVRPGREAQMIRRFHERHNPPLPFTVVSRLWREIINAMTRLQSALSVAMVDEQPEFGHDDFVRRFERVREHWGTATPLIRKQTVADMLDAISEENSIMGVLDVAGRKDWWQPLVDMRNAGRSDVFIVAPLPFVARADEQVEAYALSPLVPEESGDDLSLIAVPPGAACPLQGAELVAREDGAASSLLVVKGFIDHKDAEIAAQLAAAHAVFLGAYAAPLVTGA